MLCGEKAVTSITKYMYVDVKILISKRKSKNAFT